MGRWWQGRKEADGLGVHFRGRNNRTSDSWDVDGEGKTEMICDSYDM